MENYDFDDDQHVMVKVNSGEDGSDEWYCPRCGRRLLIRWPPNYKRTVLETGDENAIHAGGKGGLFLSHAQILAQKDTAEISDSPELHEPGSINPADPAYLDHWEQWLNQAGFNEWWDRD